MNICHYKCLQEKETCCTKTKVRKLTPTNSTKPEIELYEMAPAGFSPLHSHKTQHTLLVLEGEGAVFDGEKTLPIQLDDVVNIEANEPHQIRNIGKKPLKFLAITTQPKQ